MIQYIGARYVPKFFEGSNGAEWESGLVYEPLTIVTYLGSSWTSKKEVPANIGRPNLNPEYWVCTGNYDEQTQQVLDAYSAVLGDIGNINEDVSGLQSDITALTPKVDSIYDVFKKENKEVTLVNLYNHGASSTNIIYSGDRGVIYDFGRDAEASDLLNFLHTNGITTVILVVSHYHADHVNGIYAVLNDPSVTVTHVYLPHKDIVWGSVVGGSEYADRETALIARLGSSNIPYSKPSNGSTVMIFDNTVELKFLNTNPIFYSDYYSCMLNQWDNVTEVTNYNNFSMIMLVTHGTNRILFTGDICYEAEEKNYNEIDSVDLYQVPHHSLERDAFNDWINKVNPEAAFINYYDETYNDVTIHNIELSHLLQFGAAVYWNRNRNNTFISRFNKIYSRGDTVRPYSLDSTIGGKYLAPGRVRAAWLTNGKVDMDKMFTPGIYITQNATQTQNYLANAPTSRSLGDIGLIIEVKSTAGDLVSPMQIVKPLQTGLDFMAVRTYSSSASAWRPWNYYVGSKLIDISDSTLNNYKHADITLDTASQHSYLRSYSGTVNFELWFTTSSAILANSNILDYTSDDASFSNFNYIGIGVDTSDGTTYPFRVLSSSQHLHIRNLTELPSGKTISFAGNFLLGGRVI